MISKFGLCHLDYVIIFGLTPQKPVHCPAEEDLNILTDSLSSTRLLMGMQRRDLPLSLYRHSVRQLLLHVVKLINKRAKAGRRTRFIKVRAHRGELLNEAADVMAAAAAESDPAR